MLEVGGALRFRLEEEIIGQLVQTAEYRTAE
jgi:hypothetical protein